MLLQYVDFVKSRFKSADNTHQDIVYKVTPEATARLHAAIGILGELIEFKNAVTAENQKEELGDAYFYMVAAIQELHEPKGLVYWTHRIPNLSIDMLIDKAATLADLSKKEVMYAKILSEDQKATYRNTLITLINAFEQFLKEATFIDGARYTVDELMDSNTAKLSKRYEKGYSNEAAATRADKPEGE